MHSISIHEFSSIKTDYIVTLYPVDKGLAQIDPDDGESCDMVLPAHLRWLDNKLYVRKDELMSRPVWSVQCEHPLYNVIEFSIDPSDRREVMSLGGSRYSPTYVGAFFCRVVSIVSVKDYWTVNVPTMKLRLYNVPDEQKTEEICV